MNKRRKEKLDQRARQHAESREPGVNTWERSYTGFQEGYRAAMRDARKVITEAEAQWLAMHQHGATGPQALRRTMLLDAIKRFLLPLR